MSLSTASNRVVATGDGVTVTFYFNRLLYDATHLQVYVAGVLQTSGYTVSGVPGTSTYVTFSAAPAASAQVILLRVVPLTQLSVYAVGGAFPAATTEKNFDLAFCALQQFDEINDRAVTLPVTSTLTAADIPDPALPANYNRGIKIKGDGSGLDTFVISGAASGIVTTKGDLHIYGAGAEDRMPVGANGSFLIGASGEARGLKYFAPGTNGYVLQSDSAQTDKLIWVAPNQPANPIINGNMEIWQRGTTFAAASGYTADRWQWTTVGAGVVTVNRSTNVPTVAQSGVLYNYSLEVDVTTLDASMAASDNYLVTHKIEGSNWRHFAQREITVSFWVMSTKTGIHSLGLINNAGDRSVVKEYTVSVADTWEYKTITIPASPSAGTWNYATSIGVAMYWALNAGTNFTTSTLDTWQSSNKIVSTNQVNVMDSTSNFFRITGVKMELGSVATPIQFVPFEEELARCMRYYQKSFNYATTPAQSAGTTAATSFCSPTAGATAISALGFIKFCTPMRAGGPNPTLYNPSALNAQIRNTTKVADCSSTGTSFFSEQGFAVGTTLNVTAVIGDQLTVHWAADAEL